jgi:pyruvate ferredoxin oxidoreductase delta subunit
LEEAQIKRFSRPRTWRELPIETAGSSINQLGGSGGQIIKTGDWRAFRPVVDSSKCVQCGMCETFCPENAIALKEESVTVDYDYCKGCGICAHECRVSAIGMVKEAV